MLSLELIINFVHAFHNVEFLSLAFNNYLYSFLDNHFDDSLALSTSAHEYDQEIIVISFWVPEFSNGKVICVLLAYLRDEITFNQPAVLLLYGVRTVVYPHQVKVWISAEGHVVLNHYKVVFLMVSLEVQGEIEGEGSIEGVLMGAWDRKVWVLVWLLRAHLLLSLALSLGLCLASIVYLL